MSHSNPTHKAHPDICLTCPPLCPLVSRWFYYYPFTNVPPRDLCASSRGSGPNLPTRALLLGCGDMISLGHTLLLNQTCADAEAWASTPLQAICCDIEPAIIARNLVYLQLLRNLMTANKNNILSPRDALIAWEAVYSIFITKSVADILERAIHDVWSTLSIQQQRDKTEEMTSPSTTTTTTPLRVCGAHVTGDDSKVCEMLHWWLGLLQHSICCGKDLVEKVEKVRSLLVGKALKGRGGEGDRVERYDNLAANAKIFELGDLSEAITDYINNGYADVRVGDGEEVSPKDTDIRDVINPTFLADMVDFYSTYRKSYENAAAQDIAKVWRVHYAPHPFSSIPLELWKIYDEAATWSTRFVDRGGRPRRLSSSEICFEMFSLRSEALGKALLSGKHMIVLHCGDALKLCDALAPQHPRVWSMSEVDTVKNLLEQLKTIGAPTTFDMIDTSNLADDLGALPVLLAAAPLLATTDDNPRAVLATDLIKGLGKDQIEILKNSLGSIPLWLIPYAIGVQLDCIRSYEHRDSRAKADPTSNWTAYPRSFLERAHASAGHAGQSAYRMRWRRCHLNFDKICVGDSPEIENIIHKAMDLATTSGGRVHPLGVPTVVRFLDALFRSGCLTERIKDDSMLLISAVMISKAVAKTPFSMIPHYTQGYHALCCLNGLTTFQDLYGENIPLVEAVLQVPSDWRSQRHSSLGMPGIGGACGDSCDRPDYRFVDVMFSFGIGRQVIFTGYMLEDDKIHIIMPYDVSTQPVLSVNITSTSIIPDTIALSASVVSRTRIPSRLYASEPTPPKSSLPFILRRWLPDGGAHFIVRLIDETRLVAIRKKDPVKCVVEACAPNILVVMTEDVPLVRVSLPVEVSANDVHIKVSRTSATLDITVPVKSSCPLSTISALPRSACGCMESKRLLGPIPKLSDETLGSFEYPISDVRKSWAAYCLDGLMLPRETADGTGLRQLRVNLCRLFSHTLQAREQGQPWGGRPIMSLAREGSNDVILLISRDVYFDWTYGFTIRAGVCILKPEAVCEVASEVMRLTFLQCSTDDNSEEFRYWTEEYIPAAIQLASSSRGSTDTSSTSFWTDWLGWESMPLSSACISYFSPAILFPLGYTDTAVAGGTVSPSLGEIRDMMGPDFLGKPEDFEELRKKIERMAPERSSQRPVQRAPHLASSSLLGLNSSQACGASSPKCSLCVVCNKPGQSRCSRCKKVYYCSTQCQRVDWLTHKKGCQKE